MTMCSEPTNGAEVVAARLIALVRSSTPGNAAALDNAGSIRLRDCVVWGFCMQRATRRKPQSPVRLHPS